MVDLGQFSGLRARLAKERVVFLRGFNTPIHPRHGRKKNNVGRDNLNAPDDGLQINQKRIGKKT